MQNVAEIDEISWGEKIQKVTLPAAERAIYLELEHYLRAVDMTVKRGKKSESDREKRLAQALGDSRYVWTHLIRRPQTDECVVLRRRHFSSAVHISSSRPPTLRTP